MSNVTGGTNPGIVIGGTGQSSVDPGSVTDSSQRAATPPHCPACEAAVRERDDLRARIEAMNLQGAHYINIVVRRNGEDHIYEGDWLRALLAEKGER